MPVTKRINFWSSPRNISTALMYSFAQRSDTRVVDEPLYAHYLHHGQPAVLHPAERDILKHQDKDGRKVIEKVLRGAYDRPVVLFKQMTHHLVNLEWDFMRDMDNVMLIRNPKEIIASYSKIIPNPSITDIGVRKQIQLYHFLEDHGCLTAIIDAKELLLNPPHVLRKLCERLEIPFEENMLHWEAGPRPEDGVWAPHWYRQVHKSTGFIKYKEKQLELTPAQTVLAQQCQPYYSRLYELSIKAFE